MPTRHLPLIALILLLPVAVIVFLSVHSLSLEQESLKARGERLSRQRLQTALTFIDSRLQTVGLESFVKTTALFSKEGNRMLAERARQRHFQYALVLENGAPSYSATALEHQYEALKVLQDQSVLLARTLDGTKKTAARLTLVQGGLALLRCSRGDDGLDLCVTFGNADVMGVLNAAIRSLEDDAGLTHIRFVEPGGKVIGAGTQPPDNENVSIQLTGLMSAWRMYAKQEPLSTRSELRSSLIMYVLAGTLIAGWIAMVWTLYRSAALKEEAASARANVIAQLAHELRTPLANLRLHTDLLRRKSADTAAVQRYGDVLDTEIDRLSNLAENAVAVARGSLAEPKLELAIPDDCLREIIRTYEPLLDAAKCKISFEPGASRMVRYDKTSWERCAINLIDNARKYAAGTGIEISTLQSAQVLRLDVVDSGPGLSPGQRELIFEPLERGETLNVSGFGLGLAAVRTLARQNGGNCYVKASSTGAHFVLTMQALSSNELGEKGR